MPAIGPIKRKDLIAYLRRLGYEQPVLGGDHQEETTVLGVQCLTMRPNTERPITCEIGTNVLVETNPKRILHEATAILDGRTRPGAMPGKWDGHAAERIVDDLLNQAVADRFPVPE
jgi:UDP-N-acetylglucosamine 2-epimerase